MSQNAQAVAHSVTRASDEERIAFPEVLAQLQAAGIERYHTDLVRAEKLFYEPSGASVRVPCHELSAQPTETFVARDVELAIRASQTGAIGYREFCRRIAAAGCVAYLVSLTGRRVVYWGRTGDAHVEPFPRAP